MEAELSAPISRESVACYELVLKFLSEPSGPVHDYLQDLLGQGVPALRIDCGFDYSSNRAFFNEFGIPTDGSYWPTVHNLPLPLHVAELIGFMLFDALDQSSGAAAEGAAAQGAAAEGAATSLHGGETTESGASSASAGIATTSYASSDMDESK